MVKGDPCAYCGAPSIHVEHVVPKALLRRRESEVSIHRLDPLPAWVRDTVWACGRCNWRKGNRRLVPPSWAGRIEALETLFPGTPWRVWTGDPQSPAYAAVHV